MNKPLPSTYLLYINYLSRTLGTGVAQSNGAVVGQMLELQTKN